MININKLKGKIVENGYSVERFAVAMGKDRSTLYRMLRVPEKAISVGDAVAIAKKLNMTRDEAIAIFFGDIVA